MHAIAAVSMTRVTRFANLTLLSRGLRPEHAVECFAFVLASPVRSGFPVFICPLPQAGPA
ncbi:hypothetical protein FHX63_003618 [Cupriavidus plantarum]|uniref:Uncharacterized protein n=1 Tax=Cupriavidus plantarum TaxID=942865 RepID=A0A316ERX2_9BURK|nr:hypothetical protein [Cupriavidus plantarum]PWK35207.1 hypothetical protein C7419_102485 [Cupriavidus plantarum]REE93652.1 hypothetical protein C7418_2422 [Cupriavidus plantarum]RLK39073.1 hypothetical protein C7417_2605 [Cupriavidus plantarum]CAG2135547.1 hypothetical protein LMG26296_02213 [Cupriavidus plantarum]